MKKSKLITIDNISYTLFSTIGNGGSGDVWKAKSNGNEYAIKFINSDKKDKIERFRKEIEFCKINNHKNIIKLIADGEENGTLYYIMPLYPLTLKDLIDTEKDANIFINYILKLCNALKYIHKKGIFHRDIKPENILINNNDLVLADFGIAHFKEFQLTKKGDLLANRNYAAPEQKEKNNAYNITEAADIFALGLIINECFTKQSPSGSNFKLIADSQPLYSGLDNLVANMIKQNPSERLNIDSVITEIKFTHYKIKQDLQEIATILKEKTELSAINKPLSRAIIKRSSEDILFGKNLFYSKTTEELNKYNRYWHMKLQYSVDDFLYNLYIQEQIYSACKGKFEYESNLYSINKWYKVLDLDNNKEHQSLYKQIIYILDKYKLSKTKEAHFDLSTKILKYFTACCDYHCKEILKNIEHIENSAYKNLKNSPIIYIINSLRNGIRQKKDLLLEERTDFNFVEHIEISSKCLDTYLENYDDNELIDSQYIEDEQQIQEILYTLQKKWKVIYNKLNEDDYSIIFKTYKQYEKFRKYALDLSSPYYIFEGDVIDLLKSPNFIGNMVELKFGVVFDIPHTIAKIIGLRDINR